MTTEEKKVDVGKVMAANIERLVETIQGKIKKNGGSLEEQMFCHYQRCLLYLDAEGKVKGRPKWMLSFAIIAKDVHQRCSELKAQYDDLVAQVKTLKGKAAKEAADAIKAKEEAKAAKKAEKKTAKVAEEKAKVEAKAAKKVEKKTAKAAKVEKAKAEKAATKAKAKAEKVEKKAAKPAKKAANKAANPGNKSTKKAEKKSAGKAKA